MRGSIRLILLALSVMAALTWSAAWAQSPSGTPPAGPDAATLADAVSVAGGEFHSCLITSQGGLKCWGSNYYGQLGDGTTTPSLTPIDVAGLTSGVQAVSLGEMHSCALTIDGGMKCWGLSLSGQTGTGSGAYVLLPTDVVGLTSNVQSIAAAGSSSCAVTQGGAAKCWGANSSGQVGDGSYQDRRTPVQVEGLGSGVAAVSVSGTHACALLGDGSVKCWGNNGHGRLGIGSWSPIDSPLPLAVVELGGKVTSLAARYTHVCVVLESGALQCWGGNAYGQLGIGSTEPQIKPVTVVPFTSETVAQVVAGGDHTCALGSQGGLRCWGDNGAGQLGDGTNNPQLLPSPVSPLPGSVRLLATGSYHMCANLTGGGLYCWGANGSGQLGDGSKESRSLPVAVTGYAQEPFVPTNWVYLPSIVR